MDHGRTSGRLPARRALLTLLIAAAILLPASGAHAAAGDWGFAAEVGSIVGTAGGTPFVFRLTPAKMLSDEFSLGGSFYLTPAGDAQMYSGSLLAQYHIQLQRTAISPFIGLGIGHRESQTGDGDTAFMFPLGASFELPVGNELSVVGTMSINIHDLELDGEEDAASTGITFGINYMP